MAKKTNPKNVPARNVTKENNKKSSSSKPKISELIYALEHRMPLTCTEDWDNVGLLCGDASTPLSGVVIGVDLTENLLALALKEKANFIIIHHPPLCPKGRGIEKLTAGRSNDLNTLMLQAFKNDICIYVAHTNFDRCALDGMLQLASDLGAEPFARICEAPKDGQTLLKKLVTYVPIEQYDTVRDALFSVGCGHIGNYDSCGFATAGIGNFRPLNGASPYVGKVGELEQTEEIRFETIVVQGMENLVIETLKDAHPYEEVAYDLYPLEQSPVMKGFVWGLGYGFVANLVEPVSFDDFSKRVKSVFKIKNFLTNQVVPKMVKKIAFTPGKGSSFVKSVRGHKVDVFLTGEVGFHHSIGAARAGMNVIELGHRESELYFLKTLHLWCKEWELRHHVLDERLQRTV